jgi:hypothetical protein
VSVDVGKGSTKILSMRFEGVWALLGVLEAEVRLSQRMWRFDYANRGWWQSKWRWNLGTGHTRRAGGRGGTTCCAAGMDSSALPPAELENAELSCHLPVSVVRIPPTSWRTSSARSAR